MPARASKRKPREDFAETAFRVVAEATGQSSPAEPESKTYLNATSAAAAALSRLGASKGGKARAAKLSSAKRKAIAKKAASARWGPRK